MAEVIWIWKFETKPTNTCMAILYRLTVFKQIFLCMCLINSMVFQTTLSETTNVDTLVKWNAYFDDDILWSQKVSHIGLCAVMCLRMTLCASFNFDLATDDCILNSNLLENHPDRLLRKQNSVYSKIQDWPEMVDPDCYHRPCEKDEVCIPEPVTRYLSTTTRCLRIRGSSSSTRESSTASTYSSSLTTSSSTPTSELTSTTTTSTLTTSSSTPISELTSSTTTSTLTTSPSTPTSELTSSTTTSTLTTSSSTRTTESTSTTACSSATTTTTTRTTTTTTTTTLPPPTTTQSVSDCLAGLDPYSGTAAVTNSGETCQYWASQVPHQHTYGDSADFPYDDSLESASNYCREHGERGRPWCYTDNPDIRWGYCTFNICQAVTNECGGTVTDSSGSLSPSVGSNPTNLDCVWIVQAPYDHVIRYQVEVMKRENPNECVLIFPLSVFHPPVKRYFCGEEYQLEMRETTSNILTAYYYTDINVEPLIFTLYFKTSAVGTNDMVTCFSLLPPKNGRVDVLPDTQVGQTASYSCDVCHHLSGSETRTCTSTGSWDGTQPSCLANPSYGNSCYYFFMTSETWLQAVVLCEELHANSHLLELESAEENAFIVDKLNNMEGGLDNHWWIGLSDIENEGSFVWKTGTIGLSHTDWRPGQPNQSGDEDCVILNRNSEFQWADRPCSSYFYFICEVDLAQAV